MEKRTLIHLACFALALSVILGSSTIYYAYQYLQYESYTEAQLVRGASRTVEDARPYRYTEIYNFPAKLHSNFEGGKTYESYNCGSRNRRSY